MAQYDVYPNPSTTAGQGIPYVVIIQSDLLDSLSTRLTIPLATLSYSGKVPSTLRPLVTVKGQRLHALAISQRRCLPNCCASLLVLSRHKPAHWCSTHWSQSVRLLLLRGSPNARCLATLAVGS